MTSHPCFTAAAVCLLAPFALAQTPAMMTPNISSPSGAVSQNIYAVDLNNDGVLDLVQDTLNQPNGFNVSIANGDGTFKAPVFYSVPTAGLVPTPIATGDFNNDGNADVVVLIAGGNQIVELLADCGYRIDKHFVAGKSLIVMADKPNCQNSKGSSMSGFFLKMPGVFCKAIA